MLLLLPYKLLRNIKNVTNACTEVLFLDGDWRVLSTRYMYVCGCSAMASCRGVARRRWPARRFLVHAFYSTFVLWLEARSHFYLRERELCLFARGLPCVFHHSEGKCEMASLLAADVQVPLHLVCDLEEPRWRTDVFTIERRPVLLKRAESQRGIIRPFESDGNVILGSIVLF